MPQKVQVDRRRHRKRLEPVYFRRRLAALGCLLLLVGAIIAVATLLTSSGPSRPAAAVHHLAESTSPGSAKTTSLSWLQPAVGPGHLMPGSDPSVLPGPILIADKANNRLLIVDPQGRIRWQFPRQGTSVPQGFRIPDDAFFSPSGREIIATQEDDFAISVIDVATERIIWRYGTPGTSGSGPNQLWNPDDAMLLPDGYLLSADIKNCRIILVAPGKHVVARQLGSTGTCQHNPPSTFGSPNGVFPMRNGHYLVTEINGNWVDEMTLSGKVIWSTHPGVVYPSDSNEIGLNRYLTVGYNDPGMVVIFNAAGKILWRFAPKGASALNHPSLALPLPNGDILLNDDWNDRVIVVDVRTKRIVWQYGHTNVAGTAPGYLHIPDGVDLVPPYSLNVTHGPSMGKP